MRVIILAATSQKAQIADALIQHKDLSKVVLSVSSKKLVNQAQALIIYFESQEDLQKMSSLYKIYSGCPLKFYFGKKRYFNFQHFYLFEEVESLVKEIFEQYKSLGESADVIYDMVLTHDAKEIVTVDSMLSDMKKTKDIIEEPCMELF